MQQLFDREELQKVQDHFCTLTHLFAYCVDQDGQKITEMSGDSEGIGVIREHISEERLYRMFQRVSESPLEDIIEEPTKYDNLKLAAVSVEEKGYRNNCWLICCVLNDVTEGNILEVPGEGTSLETFYSALDLLAEIEHKLLQAEGEMITAQVESQRSKALSQSLAAVSNVWKP